MRLPRKLKKKVIKIFGRGTYNGILGGYIAVTTYYKGKGVVTKYTDKFNGKPFYYSHQFNPYIMLQNINKPKQTIEE
jgi:hypothetical protein